MSYDQHGKHSTWEFGKQSVMQGVAMLPPAKLTMGLPFYSRDVRTGEWDTYEVSTDAASRKASAPPPSSHTRACSLLSSHLLLFSHLLLVLYVCMCTEPCKQNTAAICFMHPSAR